MKHLSICVTAALASFALENVALAQFDDCSFPTGIIGTSSVFPMNNTAATTSGFNGGSTPSSGGQPCFWYGSMSGLEQEIHKDLFIAWTVPCDGDYVIDTEGSTVSDTKLNVHLGSDCSATCFAGDDDGGTGLLSQVQVTGALQGEKYLIQVGLFSASTTAGDITLNINPVAAPLCAQGDSCFDPYAVLGSAISVTKDHSAFTTSGFNGGSIPSSGGQPCFPYGSMTGPEQEIHNDVFWIWRAPCAGDYTIDTEGSVVTDTKLNVHFGGTSYCGSCYAGDDDSGTGQLSQVTLLGVSEGDAFTIQVGMASPSVLPGDITLNINRVGPSCNVLNDDCAAPTPIIGTGTFSYDNSMASQSGFDGGDPVICIGGVGEGMHYDLFFAWTPTSSVQHRVTTCISGFNTTLNMHVGADCSATCMVGLDGGSCSALDDFELDVFVTSGTTYLLQVGTWSSSGPTGPTELDISLLPPGNDNCSSPTSLPSEEATVFLNNQGATTSGFNGNEVSSVGGQPCFAHGSMGMFEQEIHFDRFYTWTPPCDGDYAFELSSSSFLPDTKINVHTGSDCSAVCLEGDDGLDQITQVVIAGAGEGTTYLIQVGMFSAGEPAGDLVLDISRVGLPCQQQISILCDPNLDHYGGDYVKLDSSYLGSGVQSDLHIEAMDGPPGEFGFFLVSSSATSSIAAFSGILCLDAPSARYNANVATNQGIPELNSIGQFNVDGVLENLAGNAVSTGGTGYDVPVELPYSPAGQVIQPGDTWCFQFWYRDQTPPLPNPGSSANFSNVIEVQFP